jgi:hypothetical protein
MPRAHLHFSDQRPFLNLVDQQTITMGCANKRQNLLAKQLWLKLSGPKVKRTQLALLVWQDLARKE